MDQRFDEVVLTRQRLRELVPEQTGKHVLQKDADHINDIARRFIAASPFAVIATIGPDGLPDVSPKGDPAGFVEVLDEKTLIIPDRPGNRRLDGFENILQNPAVAILFVIPGNSESLRVAGRGKIVIDAAVQARHAVNGKAPVLSLVVEVQQAFMHCSKAFIRSHLWSPEEWRDRSGVPTLAEWVKSTVDVEETVEQLQAKHEEVYRTNLY